MGMGTGVMANLDISTEFRTYCFLQKRHFASKFGSLRLINQELICSKIVENTAVYNIFQNTLDNADVVITGGEFQDLLYALLTLFV